MNRLIWEAIDDDRPHWKRFPDSILGPRFGHSAHYITTIHPITSAARSNQAGYVLIYSGYKAFPAGNPVAHVHLFHTKSRAWSLLELAESGDAATSRAFHIYTVSLCNQYLVIQGGIVSTFPDPKASSDIHTFHLETIV